MSSAADGPPRRGLGRGLELLMGGQEPTGVELLELPVDAIHPNPRQPRRASTARPPRGSRSRSARQGVIQPLLVRPRAAGGYELVAGERRWRAAREAGRPTVPAVVREADDRDTLLLGLIENVAREQLTPVEEARAYAVLIDEFCALARRRRRACRPVEAVGLEPDPAARASGRRARHGRARPARPRVMRAPCSRCRITRDAAASRARSCGRDCRCARPSSARSGPARSRSRASARRRSIPRSPTRVRSAFAHLTGFHAKVGHGRVELVFADEHELEELAEALERAAARL